MMSALVAMTDTIPELRARVRTIIFPGSADRKSIIAWNAAWLSAEKQKAPKPKIDMPNWVWPHGWTEKVEAKRARRSKRGSASPNEIESDLTWRDVDPEFDLHENDFQPELLDALKNSLSASPRSSHMPTPEPTLMPAAECPRAVPSPVTIVANRAIIPGNSRAPTPVKPTTTRIGQHDQSGGLSHTEWCFGTHMALIEPRV